MFDNLNIREVNNKDIDFVYYLNNESSVRKNSFNLEPIKLTNHKKWFNNQLKYNKQLFFILEANKKSVGQVRFELKKDHFVIGISISEKHRGEGYAIKGLDLTMEDYFKYNSYPVYAYIKKSNTASVRLFEKAGFQYFKNDIVDNIESVIYIKEKNED